MAQKLVIQCPKCGVEYLPGEIYMPNHFLGQPKDVVKDFSGKVLECDGVEQNLHESYICDKCGCHFNVDANITFTAQEDKRYSSTEHVTEKYSNRIQLSEE